MRCHEVGPESTASRTVSFVDEDEDILSGAQVGSYPIKLVDHRDDEPTPVRPEQLFQVLLRICDPNIPEAKSFEVRCHLCLQLDPVDDNKDGRVLQRLVVDEQSCCRNHRVGLAGALRVPAEGSAFDRILRPLHYPIRSTHLMWTKYEFV